MISRLFFLLAGIEGLFVIGWILHSPSEAGNARLLGLSPMRLFLLGCASVVDLSAFGLFLSSWWKRSWFEGLRDRLKVYAEKKAVSVIVISLCSAGALAGAQLAIYATVVEEPVVQAYLVRLQPLLVWLALICGQLMVLFFCWRFQTRRSNLFRQRDFLAIIAIFGLFLLIWAWLAKTGYGFAEETPERGVFHHPGTPLLGAQVVLGGVISLGIWGLSKVFRGRKFFSISSSHVKMDLILGMLVWVATFAVWMSAPLKASWFADAPRSPNYTFSPNSDAYLYEAVGQSLLVGSGFWHPQWGPSVARPMYSALLAFFHLLGGPGYEDIIPWQVAFLATFPVIVYCLTSRLHTRISGILAALFVMLREYNAIVLADTITVSHAKVLMADLPAALGGALILLLVVLWVQNPRRNGVYPLWAGGAIGFFLLFRLEVWALFAGFAFAGLALWRHPSSWIKGSALAALGFCLMVAPWVWRNWQLTQSIYIINPTYEQRIIEKLLGIGGASPAPDRAYASNHANKVASLLIPSRIRKADSNPTAQEWSSGEKLLHHYFNNQVQAILYLPMSSNLLFATVHSGIANQTADWYSMCCSSEGYVRDLPYWWSEWDGALASVSYLPMGLSLLVVSAGIHGLWKQQKFAGLLPFLTGAGYLLFLALMNRSGGRWILEVDWLSMVVYSVGLVEIVSGIATWISEKPGTNALEESTPNTSPQTFWHYFVPALLILLFGASLPLIERYVPRRYTQADIEARLNNLLADKNDMLSEDEELLLREVLQADVSLWSGRALYPRYFQAGDGMDGMGGTYKRPFSRIEFFLVGSDNLWGVFPYSEAGVGFPHGAEVLVIGDQKTIHYTIEIAALIIYPTGRLMPNEILWSDANPENLQEYWK